MERVHDMLTLTVLLEADPGAAVRVDLIQPAWFHSNCAIDGARLSVGYWLLRGAFWDQANGYPTPIWVGHCSEPGVECYGCGRYI